MVDYLFLIWDRLSWQSSEARSYERDPYWIQVEFNMRKHVIVIIVTAESWNDKYIKVLTIVSQLECAFVV